MHCTLSVPIWGDGDLGMGTGCVDRLPQADSLATRIAAQCVVTGVAPMHSYLRESQLGYRYALRG